MTVEQAEQLLLNIVDSVALTKQQRDALYLAIKILKESK